MTSTHTTGFAHVHDTQLYYEVAGQGHPLVLVHGALVHQGLWDDQFTAFAQDFRVVRYDMRGFGNSGLITAETAPYSSVEDLAALLDFLGISKTYILGLSAGGGVAIDFTLLHPDRVDALIAVGAGLMGYEPASAQNDPWQETEAALQQGQIAQAVELMLRYWTDGPYRTPDQVNATARERVRAMTTHNYQRSDSQDRSWPIPVTPPAASRLAEITVPTLVITGAQDVAEISEVADYLMAGIKNVSRASIPDAAHHPNLEKPDEFNKIVLDFLHSLA